MRKFKFVFKWNTKIDVLIVDNNYAKLKFEDLKVIHFNKNFFRIKCMI